MMDYGWLAIEQIAHQRIGFFVDDDNRILYWPTNRGPGYVLGFDAADQLLAVMHKSNLRERVVSGLVALSVFGLIFLSDVIYPYLSDHFAPGNSFVLSLSAYSFSALICLAGVLDYMFGDRTIPGVRAILQGCQRIDTPRPKPQYLKRSEYLKKQPKFFYAFDALVVFAGLAVVWYGVLNGEHKIGDMIAFCMVGCGLIWFAGVMAFRQHSGLMKKDIRFYVLPQGKRWSWSD